MQQTAFHENNEQHTTHTHTYYFNNHLFKFLVEPGSVTPLAPNILLVQAKLFTRRRSFAKYWKLFVACFNDVHASGYNSAGSKRIWMKFGALREYCLELSLTDFGCNPRRSESGRACLNFFVGSPNFTKFAHKMWIYVRMNSFGKHF